MIKVGTTTIPGVKYTDTLKGEWNTDGLATLNEPNGDIVINEATTIIASALRGNKAITSLTSDSITIINSSALYGCSNITELNLPNLTTIGSYALMGCSGLTKLNLPKLTSMGTPETFRNCTNLEEFSAETMVNLYNKNTIFQNCTKLKIINLPKLERMYGQSIFYDCTSLEYLVLPIFGYTSPSGTENLQAILSGNDFYNCTSFKGVDCYTLYRINGNTFKNAPSFNTFIIRNKRNKNTSVPILDNVNAFTGTPFASDGLGGTIYVPQADIASYQSATNWSTLLGYANNSILPIEGSFYETHYVDGTLITKLQDRIISINNEGSNVTISNGNHIKYENIDGTMYQCINLFTGEFASGTDVINNKPTWFSIPANKEVVFTVSNIQRTSTLTSLEMNFRKANSTTSSDFHISFNPSTTDPTTITKTFTSDELISSLFFWVGNINQRGTVEFDISMTVDGVKYI